MVTVVKGFRDFVMGGDLINVAVGLVMGLATFALVESLVASMITPIVGAIVGEPNFGALTFTINGSEFGYGAFINAAITFVLTAAAIYFFVVVPYGKYNEMRGISADTRSCPECTTSISVDARRCPACTAQVPPSVS